jgi:predicted Zn-dependent protease
MRRRPSSAIAQNFYGFRTLPAQDANQQQTAPLQGIVGFVEHDGHVLELRGMAQSDRWKGYEATVRQSVGTFKKLTDPRYLSVQPKRVEIVKLPSAMSFEQFLARYPSVADAQTVAIMNEVESGAALEAGRLMKRVVGTEPP